jgi:hypothetical protein
MNRSFRERLSSLSTSTTGGLIALMSELVPVVVFFFVSFLLIFVLFKLFVSQYSIEFSAFTKAAVAALILGKVIPLLDWAESGRLDSYRPAFVIAVKTIVYGLVVFVLGTGERIFEASRRVGTLRGGIDYVIAHANLDRSLGLVLLISLVIGAYLVLQRISRAMGEGVMLRLFFERPAAKTG